MIHEAIPEIDYEDVSVETIFLGHRFNAPIIVEAMTGGHKLAEKINATIAKVVEKLGLGMGIGSQRAGIEDKSLVYTYRVARENAPTAFLIGNLGASQLKLGYGINEAKKALEMINADALAIHLNLLQECIQPEGEPHYKGIIEKIKEVALSIDAPLIVKETGCGISFETAVKLNSVGVAAIDVAGVGGTSFALIEGLRAGKVGDYMRAHIGKAFAAWGMPTAVSIIEVRNATDLPIIASGGIRTGIDIAKALALGADMAGIALPVLKEAYSHGVEGVENLLKRLITELKIAMLLTGSQNLDELKKKPVVLSPRITNWLSQRKLTFKK